jgi:hypothetical protein
MASAISAAVAAGMGSPTMTPSALLVNPFLGLSDPASTEGKIGSLKDSGARCWLLKVAEQKQKETFVKSLKKKKEEKSSKLKIWTKTFEANRQS